METRTLVHPSNPLMFIGIDQGGDKFGVVGLHASLDKVERILDEVSAVLLVGLFVGWLAWEFKVHTATRVELTLAKVVAMGVRRSLIHLLYSSLS